MAPQKLHLLSVLAALAATSDAIRWDGPRPTGRIVNELGRSPRPTSSPSPFGTHFELAHPFGGKNKALLARQIGVNVCGWASANYYLSYICPRHSVCATDPIDELFGCCDPSALPTCYIPTACVPKTELKNCGASCQQNKQVVKCTNDMYPACQTLLFNYNTATPSSVGCGGSHLVQVYSTDYTNGPATIYTSNPAGIDMSFIVAGTISIASAGKQASPPTDSPGGGPGGHGPGSGAGSPGSGGSGGSDDSDDGVSAGAVAGGVVGGVLGLAIIGAIIWIMLRRRRHAQQREQRQGSGSKSGPAFVDNASAAFTGSPDPSSATAVSPTATYVDPRSPPGYTDGGATSAVPPGEKGKIVSPIEPHPAHPAEAYGYQLATLTPVEADSGKIVHELDATERPAS